MKIFIDDAPIDVQWENENSIGEIIEGLNSWLQKEKLTLTNFIIDGEEFIYLKGAKWLETPIENVKKLECNTISEEEEEIKELLIIVNYLELLETVAKNGEKEEILLILEEYSFIVTPLTNLTEETKKLTKFVDEAKIRVEIVKTTPFINCVTSIREELYTYYQEWENPKSFANQYKEKILEMVEPLNEVPLQFQMGEDQKALATITDFVKIFERWVNLAGAVETENSEEENKIKEYCQTVEEQLIELEEAFVSEDKVLIGDLLEYEIIPRLSEMPQLGEK